jgi:hypothetical protein
LHHAVDLMTTVVTLLAYGCPRQAIVAAYGLDERTVGEWQERSASHCHRVHEALVQQPRDLEHVQADELRVKAQGQVLWMALAIMVRTRLWLGGVIGGCRDEKLIVRLITLVRTGALARPLLFCVDGFASYVSAIRAVLRTPVPHRRRGRPRLVAWPDILVAQVIKRYQGKRVVDITRRMAQGTLEAAQRLLAQSRGGVQLNTAFIERLNATFRARLACLARRTRTLVRLQGTLERGMYLLGCVYNFCTPHDSLRLPGVIGGHKWLPRTPAMAAGITDHGWTVHELLSHQVPPAPWTPPKRRGRPSSVTKRLVQQWCP